MKKIYSAILLVLAMAVLIEPGYACSRDMGSVTTGAACSIKELNKMQESSTIKEKTNIFPRAERDLRPIKIKNKIEYNPECLYGDCMLQKIFKKPGI